MFSADCEKTTYLLFREAGRMDAPSTTVEPFGTLSDGTPVEAWKLRGRGGLTLEVLSYGGIVRRLLVPDAAGRDPANQGQNRRLNLRQS